MTALVDTTPVDTKDRLLAMLNNAEGMAYLDKAEEVINIITVTQGMWVAAKYCYKAIEIATAINNKCFSYTMDCNHVMTLRRIDMVRAKAIEMANRFHTLKQEEPKDA